MPPSTAPDASTPRRNARAEAPRDPGTKGLAQAPKPREAIQPRAPKFAFEDVPKHWFAENPLPTHVTNGVNLLFPAGEKFFVRSVVRYLDAIKDDPALKEQVRGFSGQEGHHANAHERYFATLEAQGYTVKPFLALYEKIAYEAFEKIAPHALSLATTAACEHFTAIMAERALREDVLQYAHPTMRALFLWHAAEEIEHKAVAFDVLQKVNPSFALRVAGMAIATTFLASFWFAGTTMLLRQDGIGFIEARRLLKALNQKRRKAGIDTASVGRRVFARGITSYLKRDFHPSKEDNYDLARNYLDHGLTGHPGATAA